MAFGRKEKKNPSSRYSRIEEPWLDDDKTSGGGDAFDDVGASGYGVRDSYSRQASYGRADGYYERSPYPEDGYDGRDASGYGDRADTSYDDGYDARADVPYDDGYDARADVPYDDGYDARADARYDDGYDSRGDVPYDDGYDARADAPYDDGYDIRADAPYDDGYDSRYDDGSAEAYEAGRGSARREASSAGRDRPRRKGKTGFVVKLILLLIAAAVLIVVWRFSRMRHVSLSDILTNDGVSAPSGYTEFVIYGVDSREGNLTKDAHSDTIILCSMNRATKEIRMVSVYRDTYLDNTNGEYRKATECYFFGGPSRSVNMLNKNLDLDLHDYITVDFNAVVKAVDLIGGVDVEVTEEELPYINGYQTENAEVTGAQITPVESAGYQHLNGIQALAYCRIRYTAGSDYRRTERQRAVLSQIFEHAKSQGPVKMAQIVDAMLPYIATSFSSTALLNMVTSISGSSLLDSVGFPFELQAANIAAGDCVVPVNLAQNVSELHAYLYQQNGYTPTQTVQAISDEIANNTGIY